MTLSPLHRIVRTAGAIVLALNSSGYAAEHLRQDGKLISAESGSSWTGSWKIRGNKLCLSLPSSTELECNEVWMSGTNVRMRANKDQETFDAIITRHHGN